MLTQVYLRSRFGYGVVSRKKKSLSKKKYGIRAPHQVPILLWIISETGPILCLLILFLRIARHEIKHALEFLAIACISCALIHAAVLLYMRHHLFIWTVFAPRFCYEIVYLLTHAIICTVVRVIFYFYDDFY